MALYTIKAWSVGNGTRNLQHTLSTLSAKPTPPRQGQNPHKNATFSTLSANLIFHTSKLATLSSEYVFPGKLGLIEVKPSHEAEIVESQGWMGTA